MKMKIKLYGQEYELTPWIEMKSIYGWYRQLETDYYSRVGLSLIQTIDQKCPWRWKVRFPDQWGEVVEVYYRLYPELLLFPLDQIEQAKQHVDQFLNRFNKLGVFL